MRKILHNKTKVGLIITAILFAALNVFSTNYYVSNDGNDSNSGTSISSPWKSLGKVNNFNLSPGDAVYFKKGDSWYGTLYPKSGNSSGYITYGSYGSGAKPLLHQSVQLNSTNNWIHEGGNIWTSVSSGTTGSELIPNTDFDSNTDAWSLYVASGSQATMSRDLTEYYTAPASLKISGVEMGTSSSAIQLKVGNGALSLESGQVYEVSFYIKASTPFSLSYISIIQNGPPFSSYGSFSSSVPEITTSWKQVKMLFTANTTATDASFRFFMGNTLPSGASLYIDKVSMKKTENTPLNIDVGNMILNNGSKCGVKVWNRSDLNVQDEFWYDGSSGTVKYYSSSNPASLYSDIKCAMTKVVVIIDGKSYLNIENLNVSYSGHDAIRGSSVHHINIRNIDAHFHGGGNPYNGTIRLGGGIGFWANASNILIEGCNISDVYDAALSNQSNVACTQADIIYRNNVISNSEYSFEFFNRHSSAVSRNIQFINNTCLNAGYGWSHSQRPDPYGRHICIRTIPANGEDIIIKNNIFYQAREVSMNLSNGPLSVLDIDHNCFYQTNAYVAKLPGNVMYRPSQFEQYVEDSGMEEGSFLENPLLSNNRLRAESPCIDAGNPDSPKDPDNTRADLGAFYYHHSVEISPVYYEEEINICQGESYNGWSNSGEYQRILEAASGGDSIVTTILTVNPVYNISEEITIKEGESYKGWNTNGVYGRTYQTISGCDSIVTTYLTVLERIEVSEEKSICEGYTYLGWSETGVYQRILTTSNGADSVITTILSVNPVYNLTEEITIKEGESYRGWNTSGVYESSYRTISGCDSIVTTNLNVLARIEIIEEINICEGETYLGWSESGEYERLFETANGTDSLLTTFLTIHPVYYVTEEIILKEGQTHKSWAASGVYEENLETIFGCDSTVITYLTVLERIETVEEITICEGETYLEWSETGEY
ncbi:MAG: carbohydrate binding domain-containing protein, partial [Mariniphaga sp.]|nr:carbohydrate binding domain-containing protein [Mariniphaga sp.]